MLSATSIRATQPHAWQCALLIAKACWRAHSGCTVRLQGLPKGYTVRTTRAVHGEAPLSAEGLPGQKQSQGHQ